MNTREYLMLCQTRRILMDKYGVYVTIYSSMTFDEFWSEVDPADSDYYYSSPFFSTEPEALEAGVEAAVEYIKYNGL